MQPASFLYDSFKQHFSTTLRTLCAGRGTHAEICAELGINRQQFAKYLSGNNIPSAFIIQKLVNYFDVSADLLFLNAHAKPRAGRMRPGVLPTPDVKEGFYLQYSARMIGERQYVAVSLWRIYQLQSSLLCRGQVPGTLNQQGRSTFSSYNGTITGFGSKFIMTASDAEETRLQLSVLSRQAFGPNDLISVSINSVGSEATTGEATLFRYIGAKVDLVDLLVNECGLFEPSGLNERSTTVWTTFCQQVAANTGSLSVR